MGTKYSQDSLIKTRWCGAIEVSSHFVVVGICVGAYQLSSDGDADD